MIKRKMVNIRSIEYCVLDEADEMLSMGFKDDLEFILKSASEEKQTLLFSATMTPKVSSVTKKYMKNPTEIAVARVNRGADNVHHDWKFLAPLRS